MGIISDEFWQIWAFSELISLLIQLNTIYYLKKDLNETLFRWNAKLYCKSHTKTSNIWAKTHFCVEQNFFFDLWFGTETETGIGTTTKLFLPTFYLPFFLECFVFYARQNYCFSTFVWTHKQFIVSLWSFLVAILRWMQQQIGTEQNKTKPNRTKHGELMPLLNEINDFQQFYTVRWKTIWQIWKDFDIFEQFFRVFPIDSTIECCNKHEFDSMKTKTTCFYLCVKCVIRMKCQWDGICMIWQLQRLQVDIWTINFQDFFFFNILIINMDLWSNEYIRADFGPDQWWKN